MELYYSIGKLDKKGSRYIHFEIKEAYDSRMNSLEWLKQNKLSFKENKIMNCLFDLHFPDAVSVQFPTRFAEMRMSINDIMKIVQKEGAVLIENNDIVKNIHMSTNIPTNKSSINLYFIIEEDSAFTDCPVISFYLKKNCAEVLWQGKKYKHILKILGELGCQELQEGYFELLIDIDKLINTFNKYGYQLMSA